MPLTGPQADHPAPHLEVADVADAVPEPRNVRSDGLPPSVADYGTARDRDGATALMHVAPISQATVEWLHEEIFRSVEKDGVTDDTFRESVRRVVTPERLRYEWTQLISETGWPMPAAYRGNSHPIALRVSLEVVGPSPQRVDESPADPPVGLQRWIADGADTTGASAVGNVRSGSYDYARGIDRDGKSFRA
ncbi:MAG: hypothetical protein JF597_09155 [Streptomyces sp.]|uniref:hypothetical protein n=1 Tax=Streptomyces sp. TaxID=1931 RepID=UPI0025EE12D5|nr:hypothetical protein [Streptomyces sp.]MBW8793741.1 hypothetical protein [Streptomyces sp.]